MASQFYVSEITKFLREVVKSDPSIEKSQREGRDLLWDHKLDLDLEKRKQDSAVPMKGYVYDTIPAEPGQSCLTGRPSS